MDEACRLYNAALDERRSAWRMNGLSLPNIPNYGFTDRGLVYTQGMVTMETVIDRASEIEADSSVA